MNSYRLFNQFLFLAVAMMASSCANMFGNTTTSGVLQVLPSSTTVGVDQSMTFQVVGGTPPYTFSDSGVGSVDTSGDYNSGASTGTSQVIVTDASGNTGYATVSVVTYGSSVATADVSASGWSAVNAADPASDAWVRGQLVGVDDRTLQTGHRIHSEFLVTQLKHPLVRKDEMLDGQSEVATRALVEDQFLVKLQNGYSPADLSSILSNEGARISKKLSSGAYLVSMARTGELNTSGVSSDFMVKRERLKQELKTIAEVTPHYLSRVPASVSANASLGAQDQ